MHFFYCVVYYILNVYFRILYRLEIYDQENIPQGPCLLAPNHVSYYDPPLVGVSCPEEIHYLARQPLFDHWFLALLIRNLNAHPVHGTTDDLATFKLICQLLKEGKKVVIFPEGARTEDGKLGEIKSGAAMLALRCKVPIVPIAIQGGYRIWPIHNRLPKFWGKLRIIYGKPIPWEEYQEMERRAAYEAITERLSKAILELKAQLDSKENRF